MGEGSPADKSTPRVDAVGAGFAAIPADGNGKVVAAEPPAPGAVAAGESVGLGGVVGRGVGGGVGAGVAFGKPEAVNDRTSVRALPDVSRTHHVKV
jgi:hypothetical protein